MIVVIISGGNGSRLWPVSTKTQPKPFLKLNNKEESLLQKTFLRASLCKDVSRIITVTNEDLHFKMLNEYQAVNPGNIPQDFILEPFGRNTAAAIIATCLFIKNNYNPDETILILPADHLISDTKEFSNMVQNAHDLANKGYLVTFGIKPSYPETGYGYIQANKNQPLEQGYLIERFVEKPNLATAKEYLLSGEYLWNSGMFCGKVSLFLEEIQHYALQLHDDLIYCLEQSKVNTSSGEQTIYLDPKAFDKVQNTSIDYALFEQSHKTVVIPCNIGWSDIGTWLSIANELPKDQAGNTLVGNIITKDSKNCLFYSDKDVIAGINLQDLVVISHNNAVLVAHRNNTQDVKTVFEEAKQFESNNSEIGQTFHRPWGTYTIIEEHANYKIKRIDVKPGASLSLQMHNLRSEHWIVIEGIAHVTNGDNIIELQSNQSTFIPVKTKHRLENKTTSNLAIIEVQCGSYLGEDDIIRFDDIYGRDTK